MDFNPLPSPRKALETLQGIDLPAGLCAAATAETRRGRMTYWIFRTRWSGWWRPGLDLLGLRATNDKRGEPPERGYRGEGFEQRHSEIDQEQIRDQLGKIVRGSVEETLNALLDAEADRLCNAGRYERTEARRDTRAGFYERRLHTRAGGFG